MKLVLRNSKRVVETVPDGDFTVTIKKLPHSCIKGCDSIKYTIGKDMRYGDYVQCVACGLILYIKN